MEYMTQRPMEHQDLKEEKHPLRSKIYRYVFLYYCIINVYNRIFHPITKVHFVHFQLQMTPDILLK